MMLMRLAGLAIAITAWLTWSFITWLVYVAYLHARATAGWRDSRAAWINIAALAMMVFNLFFINMVVSGLHSYAGLN